MSESACIIPFVLIEVYTTWKEGENVFIESLHV